MQLLLHKSQMGMLSIPIMGFLFFFRKIVLNGGTQAPYPFGIATFENHVFFTDWTKMGVMKANRFKDNNPALIYRTTKRPGHVVVSHSVLQPVGEKTHLQSLISPFDFSGQRLPGPLVLMQHNSYCFVSMIVLEKKLCQKCRLKKKLK